MNEVKIMTKTRSHECESVELEPPGVSQEVEAGETGDANEAAEAAYYLETLKANRRIANEGEALRPGQTHRIERDDKGNEILRRKRFSAV